MQPHSGLRFQLSLFGNVVANESLCQRGECCGRLVRRVIIADEQARQTALAKIVTPYPVSRSIMLEASTI